MNKNAIPAAAKPRVAKGSKIEGKNEAENTVKFPIMNDKMVEIEFTAI